jgi:hypothetical protein
MVVETTSTSIYISNVVDNTRLSDVLVFMVVTLLAVKLLTDISREIAFKNAFVNSPDTVCHIFVAIRLTFLDFRII